MKVGIIGANGYGGAELIRLLHQHPNVEIEMLISNSTKGSLLTDQYKHFHYIFEKSLEEWNPDEIQSKVDVLFFATPSGVSKEIIPQLIERDIICIDLSGDFRLKDEYLYEKWYKNKSANIEDLQKSVYGLTEINRNEIKKATLIANPGCYPTATLLGLAPILKANVINMNSIIIDGKSGVSGAGRKPNVGSLFSEVNENVTAYKLGKHQHIPEIEQEIQNICGFPATVTFTTHLIPMTRGIMCTIYANLKKNMSLEEMLELYQETYLEESFIRIRPKDKLPSTKEVYGSNYCDIGLNVDERTGRITIISVIDNLVKGAAGQAIQNLNVIAGWDERTGLNGIPIYP
ncbi:N-acetyl-gamma-glutamyl-phosphate reductase [Heyndrickxia shackletonii]|uniref:N-acetyl-gamma-glutamyl-phosphate reductase n=1 Tax=Heyndrickxia shackletonii TaxID=157838 RepID=A0A0Q3TLB9_9BACI|nr:N-acetyl-gamma-glutamyl-phosphate reductase [Heyndrickxia shackletonii]MBB2479686.1 N-acetyl-gamma-glutamyl-phosphate reductase [Bacillus sp. APMAM]NEY99183.1 N-acetyl-gamma-glutamyl-phosphate reductase [Heyndrickxia shackletonii]RTZ56904.1 N-acetyl-gamma-glutamyl-phosphate reductase [Bacillus sp. SAJ1]